MKRYIAMITALCLGGITLALALFLMSSGSASHASPPQEPAVPDLVINAETDSETTLADSVITYTIFYTNNLASQTLDDVIIVSTLMKQQYYSGTYHSDPLVATSGFTYSGDFDGGYSLEWQLGSLAPSAGGWVLITTTVPPEAEPPWKDSNRWPLLGMSAAITTSTPNVSVGNPQDLEADSVSVMVVGPVLRITKEDDPNSLRPGQLLTYTLALENKDREDVIAAHNIVITDAVPAYTELVWASGTGTYSPTSEGGVIIWHPPAPLGPASTLEVSFTVRLTSSLPNCSVGAVKNEKSDYHVSADETIQTVRGSNGTSTSIDDLLAKTIETSSPPEDEQKVFPGDIVTYTINVYNPRHDQPTTGLRLTDTLPGPPDTPNPFIYLNMLDGGPEPISTSQKVVWDDLSIPAGDVITLSFRAKVPEHIYIPPNNRTRDYSNNLSASAPGLNICDMTDQGPSKAKVTTQIWMEKSVEPDKVLSGELVTYTITLENDGDTLINFIRLTDTLPHTGGANFYLVNMLHGKDPETGYQHNPIVWDDLGVGANSSISLSFQVKAIGLPLETYGNDLSASAPQTTIPARTNQAKVEIDSPLRIGKVVDPSTTFVEETVTYSVTVCNVATGTYTLDRLRDTFPAGFYSGGGTNVYEHDMSPDVDLAPEDCWSHAFDMDVTIDVGCGSLPRTVKNDKGNVEIHIVSPVEADFYNATDLASLRIVPHVRLEKAANHKAVLPGETLVYTITLINDHPTLDADNVTIIDTLPGDDAGTYFEYLEMVPGGGDNPTDTGDPGAGGPIRWENQTVPANGQLTLAFRVQVPADIEVDSNYKNDVVATTDQLICIEDINPTAAVRVDDEIVELSKNVDPSEVSPFGDVSYEIDLKNIDSMPVTGVVVTETLPMATLPPHFEFAGMTNGDPEPDEINEQTVVWRDLTIPGDATLKLRFDAKAAILLGDYDNDVDAWCPRSGDIPPKAGDAVSATVTVLPGVVMYKTVFPTQTAAGKTVIYTITLNNQLAKILEDVHITDTLPAGFSYQRMIDGPTPYFRQASVVAWNKRSLGQQDSQKFVFQAKVNVEVITGTYFNKIEGTSPSALIPGSEETAPLKVRGVETVDVFLPLVLRSYSQ